MTQIDSPSSSGGSAAHPVSLRVLVIVIATLLALTGLTVAAASADLGAAGIWIALLIAMAKASLVVLYFMHLRYESLFYAVILTCALFLMVTFMAIALMDSAAYQSDIYPPPAVLSS